MKRILWHSMSMVLALMMVVAASGCRTIDETVVHDELFTYDRPYDEVFLKVINSVGGMSDWRLMGSDMTHGKLELMSNKFTQDKLVTVLIKRISRGKTSVELAPDAQGIQGVDTILKAIDKALTQ